MISPIIEIPDNENKNISANVKELREAVDVIKGYTGLQLQITSHQIQYTEFLKIQVIAGMVKTRLALYRPIILAMEKSDALEVLEQYLQGKINSDSVLMINLKDNVLGEEIEIDNILLNLSTVKTAEDLKALYKSIRIQKEKTISIKFIQAINTNADIALHVESLRRIKSAKLDLPQEVAVYQGIEYKKWGPRETIIGRPAHQRFPE